MPEADDGSDTVAWLLEQPWCDGNIGTFGPSYLGFVQWANVPGHRIRLEVSSSNFPRFDRNTNTGGTVTEEDGQDVDVAVNRVHHGPAHLSRLVLPIIDR